MSDLIERLSDHVHQAWMAEKLKQGFADHPFQGEQENWPCDVPKCGKADFQHHTDMLPYADLPEHIKEYDRVTVRAVLAAVKAEGYQIAPEARRQVVEDQGAGGSGRLTMDYPKITTCTRCGGQRWDGPEPVCAICAINIEEQERQDRRRVAAQERVRLAADLFRSPRETDQ